MGAGGVSYLIKLKDTPDAYSGNAKKALVVNDAEDAVSFDKDMLPRDGTRMMTGDLDMGSHAIEDLDILKFHGFDAAIDAVADHIVGLSNKAKTQIISLRLAYLESLTGISIGDGYMIQTDKVRARDGDGLALYEDGGAGIFVRDGGNVGIGTTTPYTELEVDGDISIHNPLSAVSRFIGLEKHDTNGIYGMEIENIEEGAAWSQAIHFLTHYSNVSAGRRMTITKGGKVGIGTTTPSEPLHVKGIAETVMRIESAAIDTPVTLRLKSYADAVTSSYDLHSDITSTSTGNNTGSLSFKVPHTETVMTLTSSGNVGIGTTTPGAKLDINGDAKLGGDLDMNNHHITEAALDLGDLDNQEYRGLILTTQIAAESLSFGNLVYHASDNRYNKTDADTISKTEGDLAIVLTPGATAENGYITVLKLGSVKNTGWSFTIGTILYISQTAGVITATEPSALGSFSRKIGYAQAANIVYFDPSHTILENG